LDWSAYIMWVFGTYLVRTPSDSCANNPIARTVALELSISTFVYIGVVLVYILIFVLHLMSRGHLFPGYVYDNSRFPESCPSITFDRNLWRRRGENVSEYRERVDNAFMRVHTIPPTSNIMVITPSMTKDEIKQLPTSVYYVDDIHETRVRIPTDETVHSTNGMCACCLEDYRNGDLLKILPCTHKFHDLCITDWLLIKSTCPVCNGMVKACE
jgi:hypothetical protein